MLFLGRTLVVFPLFRDGSSGSCKTWTARERTSSGEGEEPRNVCVGGGVGGSDAVCCVVQWASSVSIIKGEKWREIEGVASIKG